MTKARTNPKVDAYLGKLKNWRAETEKLRALILEGELVEELKWGCPCYTFADANVVLIHGFNAYCALLFFKGALLKDPKGILIQQTENVQAARQLRFTDVRQIAALSSTIQAYVEEAIGVEKAGLKVPLKKTSDFKVPTEFQKKLEASAKLKAAFAALTPGRQRAYLYHFSQAKQAKTREARVEKCLPQILAGKGLDD